MSREENNPLKKSTSPNAESNRIDSHRSINAGQSRRNVDGGPRPPDEPSTSNALGHTGEESKDTKQQKKQKQSQNEKDKEKQEQKEQKEKEKLEKKEKKEKEKKEKAEKDGKGDKKGAKPEDEAKVTELKQKKTSSRLASSSKSIGHISKQTLNDEDSKANTSKIAGHESKFESRKSGLTADSGKIASTTEPGDFQHKKSIKKSVKSSLSRKSKKSDKTRQSKTKLKTIHIKYNTDEEIGTALIEIGVFIVFLVLSTWVGLHVRDNNMFHFNESVKKMFIRRENMIAPSVSISFEKIMTVPDWWDYLLYNFIPTFHFDNVHKVSLKKMPETPGSLDTSVKNDTDDSNIYEYNSYNSYLDSESYVDLNYEGSNLDDDVYGYEDQPTDQSSPSDRQRKHTFLKENILLGPPRLRQMRVQKSSCDINNAFIRYFNICYAPYSTKVEDRTSFVGGVPWRSMLQLKTTPLWTKLNLYDGGSYSIDLTYDRTTNLHLIKKFSTIDWVDRGSRLCLIEFNLFNLNTKLLQSTKLIAELPPTGGVIPQAQIQTVKHYTFFTDSTVTRCTLYMLWYTFIIYYTITEYIEMRDLGITEYMKSFMNIMELLIIMFAYIALLYNIWHAREISNIMKKAAVTDGYQSLDQLCFWNVFYVDMMGILVFLVWLKIFKFISFNKTLIQFTTTLSRCSKDLAGFGLMFTIVFMAYAQLGLLLFGTKNPDFVDLLTSVLTMVRMILGDFQYIQMEQANRVLGPVYFLTYILLVFFILLNMFLAIIMSTYNQVKREITEGRSNLGLYVYKRLAKGFSFLMHCGRKRRPQSRAAVKLEDVQDEIIITKAEVPLEQRKQYASTDERYSERAPSAFDEQLSMEYYNKDINRLNNRVALLEEMLEQLVVNMDNILKRVEGKLKKSA